MNNKKRPPLSRRELERRIFDLGFGFLHDPFKDEYYIDGLNIKTSNLEKWIVIKEKEEEKNGRNNPT